MLKFLKMCSYQLYVPGSVPSLRAKRDLDPDQPAGHHAHHLPPQVTRVGAFQLIVQHRFTLVPQIALSVPQPVFTITEKAPTRAFSWLKAPTSAFTFKTLLRHYANQALTPR